MKIRKITLEVTILLERCDEARFSTLSLAEIAQEMDDGAFIGAMPSHLSEDVPLDRLEEELLALGNDGSFFDYLRED
ncbi:hypothetical protein PX699_16835 [Sphingobium sp. H39-3-25]|uniref:hypothetical protein n=1 Tax=Sphingomonadales TaxID=204457 RepID=UPI00082E151F|nr:MULTISPECIES: hypothetical protein [Sphingomonadaceae]MDF0491470.1 hypothetical protein [Sphingomonas pollutisoli]MDF0544020.1 hypothetical protein [Sphingobium arseniciresistens]